LIEVFGFSYFLLAVVVTQEGRGLVLQISKIEIVFSITTTTVLVMWPNTLEIFEVVMLSVVGLGLKEIIPHICLPCASQITPYTPPILLSRNHPDDLRGLAR
jgi:hypothetical protein